jgi:diacylglycerol kinase family enzyme
MRQPTLILLECQPRRSSAGPRVPLLWRHHAGEIAEALSPLELVQVADAEEAEEAAWDAAVLGFGRIVAVGGPRVAHGLVNGIMRLTEGHRRRMKVGFLTLGRPGAWERTAGLPTALTRQLEILAAGHTLPYDIGRIECLNAAGQPTASHFLLGASCGALGNSASDLSAAPLRAAQVVAGALSTLGRSLFGRMPSVSLQVDGHEVYRGPWALAMVMGGTHYPVFGQTAPGANPSDGAMDVVWIPAPDPIRLAGHALSLWINSRFNLEGFPMPPRCTGTEVRVIPLGEPVGRGYAIEADGVPIGSLPAKMQVIPRTFPVIVEAVAARLRERTRMTAEIRGATLAGAGGWRREGLRRIGIGSLLFAIPHRRVRVRRPQPPWASESR